MQSLPSEMAFIAFLHWPLPDLHLGRGGGLWALELRQEAAREALIFVSFQETQNPLLVT